MPEDQGQNRLEGGYEAHCLKCGNLFTAYDRSDAICNPCLEEAWSRRPEDQGTEELETTGTMTVEELQNLENLLSRYVLLMTDSKSEDNRNALKVLGYVIEDRMTEETRIRNRRARYETRVLYRTGEEEVFGHLTYREALGFCQSREEVNGTGNVQTRIFRLEQGKAIWLETRGSIKEL